MSTIQILAQVRNLTGKIIKLGPFEEATEFSATDDRVTLKVSRVVTSNLKFSTRIVKRGVVLYQWNRVGGSWLAQEPFAVWWSTDELIRSCW